VAPIITGIIVHFRFHIRCISVHKLLYFNLFSASCSSCSSCSSSSYYYYYYCYLPQLSFHAVAVVLTLVTNKNKYT
jgi:hypothetical protein